jgi:hypothetical protein
MTDQFDYDPAHFNEAIEHGAQLKAQHVNRNDMQDAMEKMYLIQWDNEDMAKKGKDKVATTRSPSAHNKVEGGVRLLSTTAPKFSVPRETNQKSVDEQSSAIEKFCARLYECACRATGEKVDRAVAMSQLLFGESVIAVDRTEDIVSQLEKRKGEKEGKDPWLEVALKRAQSKAKSAPYLFTVWDPRTTYPEYDKLGLTCVYREVTSSAGAVRDEFGDVEGLSETARTDKVVLCSWWDFVYRYTWMQGTGKPIIAEAHGLPFIPIVCQLGEGSRSLFTLPENWRLPMLYPVWRSNQWDNENLLLTIAMTSTLAWGSNPMFTMVTPDLERHVEVDASVPGGVIRLTTGESFQPTGKIVIDQSVLMELERARQDIEESTIFSQTLGQPLGANATYSATALLHQAGRLPLAMPQEMAGRALASALKIALMWTKEGGKKAQAGTYNYTVELAPADIPENVELDCKLDVALPQDRLGNINVAKLATDPSNPLASKAWAQTNVLNIEQPDEMQAEIMKEQAKAMDWMIYLQQKQEEEKQRQQAAAQQQQPPQGPPPGMPPQGPGPQPGQGMPPEMMAGGMQGPGPMRGEQQQLPPDMGGENAPLPA